MKNATLTPATTARGTKKKAPPHDVTPKDNAYDRNFTKAGKPRMNAVVVGNERVKGK